MRTSWNDSNSLWTCDETDSVCFFWGNRRGVIPYWLYIKEKKRVPPLTVYKRKVKKEKKTHSTPTTKLVILAIVQCLENILSLLFGWPRQIPLWRHFWSLELRRLHSWIWSYSVHSKCSMTWVLSLPWKKVLQFAFVDLLGLLEDPN